LKQNWCHCFYLTLPGCCDWIFIYFAKLIKIMFFCGSDIEIVCSLKESKSAEFFLYTFFFSMTYIYFWARRYKKTWPTFYFSYQFVETFSTHGKKKIFYVTFFTNSEHKDYLTWYEHLIHINLHTVSYNVWTFLKKNLLLLETVHNKKELFCEFKN
jgi:hypothetical protein